MRRLITVVFIFMVAAATVPPVAADTPTPASTPTAAPAATASAPGPTVVVQAPVANVRSGPGTSYPVIGGAKKGQTFAVTGKDAGAKWWQIDFGGRPGWISAGLVQASPDASRVRTVKAIATPSVGKAAASPTPTGPVLPPFQEAVVLGEGTQYPVRAGRVKGWGYELVDELKDHDLLVNRDIFGVVINQLWPDLLKQHPKGIRITLRDADPNARYYGGFGDGESAYVVPGGCETTHTDSNGTVWRNDVVDCNIIVVSPGPGLTDIAIAAAVLTYGREVSGDFSPVFNQEPYTQLGQAVRDVETGQWHWTDPFLQVVSLAPPTPTPAPAGANTTRTPLPPATGHIAFTQARGRTTDIALVDAATGVIRVVAENGRQPDVRNDGRIVFNGTGGGRDDLQMVNPDGSNLRAVSVHPEDSAPRWSDDGRQLAFHSMLAGVNDRLFIQPNAEVREEPMHLQMNSFKGAVPLWGRFPVWSGKNLGFQGCDYWSGGGSCGIWLTGLAWAPKISDTKLQLTRNADDRPTDVAGGTLLYTSPSAGNWEIYAIPVTGGKARNLTNSPSQDLGATFSPDGNYIAFMSDRGGGWGIWVMEADGSNPRLLVSVPQGFGEGWSEERLSWGP